MNQPYFKPIHLATELMELREAGHQKGELCGLASLDEYFTLKKGYPLFVAGAPFSGKTEFVLEILLNTSLLYGWKHFIYVGEIGDVQNVVAELVHKYCRKPYIKGSVYCTDEESHEAIIFINKHFVICNHDKEFTIAEFYVVVLEAEVEYNIKFDSTLFDPFNDIKDETDSFGGREDKYLAHALKLVRIDAKRNNRVNILINHIADVRAIVDKEGNRYMPPAMPNEWAGGRTWWRRAFTMLLVYRPPTFLKDNNGMPYAENESHIYVQKSKPKGIGKIGRASIFWDWKRNRYYSFHGNQRLESCETMESIKPTGFKDSLSPDYQFESNKLNDEEKIF